MNNNKPLCLVDHHGQPCPGYPEPMKTTDCPCHCHVENQLCTCGEYMRPTKCEHCVKPIKGFSISEESWEKRFSDLFDKLPLADQMTINDYLYKRVAKAHAEGERQAVRKIYGYVEEAFNNWAAESQYITGAWNSPEYVDSDKQGEFWDNYRRTAWEQFARQLDKWATIPIDELKDKGDK